MKVLQMWLYLYFLAYSSCRIADQSQKKGDDVIRNYNFLREKYDAKVAAKGLSVIAKFPVGHERNPKLLGTFALELDSRYTESFLNSIALFTLLDSTLLYFSLLHFASFHFALLYVTLL